MQHDDMIWSVVSKQFCSFKTRTRTTDFCRNEDNVTGLCNRVSCPLANSRYATVKEDQGRIHLWVKTIERAHSPLNLWNKIPLPANYVQALSCIDQELEHWPSHMIHRCKQRLTKIHQYLIRMRKLQTTSRPKLVAIHKKIEKREATREMKALKAARITDGIKKELLERLQQGTYGDIYNFPVHQYEQALDELELSDQELSDQESVQNEFIEAYDDDIFDDDEDDDIEDYDENMSGSDHDQEPLSIRPDDTQPDQVLPKRLRKSRRGRPYVEIEYESEQAQTQPAVN